MLATVMWLCSSSSLLAAFGYSASTDFYTVDTDAGLVFKIRRTDNGSSTQSPGDIASLVYNGVEYQNQSRGSHINSGFDFLGYPTSNVTVVAQTIGTDYIKITVTTDYLTHYYMARKGYPHIYMATYFTVQPVTGGGLCRYILRLPSANLPNGPTPSEVRDTDFTVESGDIFGFSDTNSNVPFRGQTRSKHYSNMRLTDWDYIGATGENVGVWMVRDNHEGGSGGPFYRSLLNQGGGDQEITYIINYGEAQTEAFRTNILNHYTAVFTNGATPGSVDTSWFSGMGLIGYVPPTGRGTVTGAGITNRDTNSTYTVGFANATAQYFTTASAADGSFTMTGMLPGTYTMSIFKDELVVHTANVSVSAGGTTPLASVAITGDPSTAAPLWRIGDWDGTPHEFLNGDKVTTMHPSDVRMSNWSPGTYVVGTSKPSSGIPCYQWKDVNANQVIQFNLTADQVVASTIRVGITVAYSGGRPNIVVNSWTAGLQGPSSQPDTRTLTVGTYRGNNTTYTFNVPSSALVVGTNTLTVYPISGSGGTGFLSPGYSLDCIEMTQGAPTLPLPGAPSPLSATVVNSTVKLDWAPAANAMSYIVSRGTASGGPYTVIDTDINPCTYTDVTAQAGTPYFYIVRGSNSSGAGLPSAQASATTGGAPGGMVAQLRFDETTGLAAVDSTRNGWNGTLANVPSWTTGLFRGAFSLPGTTGGYLTLPDGVVSGLNDFTICGWVKPTTLDTWARIFDFGTHTAPGATTGTYMNLVPSDGGGVLRYSITTAGYSNEQVITGPAPLSAGTWTHVAVTLSGNTGKLYVNGNLVGTNNAMTLKPSNLGMTTRNYLGKSQYPDPYLNGSLDDFRIYDRALDATEIGIVASAAPAPPSSLLAAGGDKAVALKWPVASTANTYTVKRGTSAGGPYPTTVATGLTDPTFTDTGLTNDVTYYYVVSSSNSQGESANSPEARAQPDFLRARLKFDETGGTIAVDSSGDGNHAAPINSPAWEPGKINNALRLTGSSLQYAALPAGIVNGIGDITVMCWVKPSSFSTWQRIFDFGTGTANYMFLSASGPAGTGKPRFAIRTPNVGEQIIDSSIALSAGSWSHIAYSQTGGTGRLYINGNLAGSNTSMTLTAGSLGATTQNSIGKSQFPDPHLDAAVDDFRIFSRAMTLGEIGLFATPITAPQNLVATSAPLSITLTWATVANAATYTVKTSTSSGGPFSILASGLTSTSFTHDNLPYGATRYYVVTATNATDESSNSNIAGATAGSMEITQGELNSIVFDLTPNPGGSVSGTATVPNSVVGHSYQLQFRPNLNTGSWVNVGSATNGTGSTINFTITPQAGEPTGFYRILIQRL